MAAAANPRARARGKATKRQPGSGRLVDRITQELREMILEQRLAPGTVMRQIEWSERLDVSRTPLREAFRILEQDGLVRVSNGNRTVQVVQFSPDELRDLYQVREVIDGLAARLLATRGLPDAIDRELAGLLSTMDEAAEPFDAVRWFSAHMSFHLRIAEECGNRRVRQQIDLIKMTSFSLNARVAELAAADGDGVRLVLDVAGRQHRAIYDALCSGSGDLAEMAACRHIRSTLRSELITGSSR